MNRLCILFLGALLAAAAHAEAGAAATGAAGETERWNEAVSLYRSGDVTNALAVARELVGRIDPDGKVSEVGRRAADLVAKICYDRVRSGEAGDNAEALLEEASRDAQVVLRAENERRARGESLARANRNFTRATDALPGLREARRVNRIVKAAEGKDPGVLLQAAVAESRALMAESSGVLTNRAPVAVAKSAALAKRADKLAETWVAVREAISSSVTNEEQAATIVERIGQAEKRSLAAVEQLEDMQDTAYSSIAAAECDFTEFFKLTALPPAAMGEDLVCQSNAWQDVEKINERSWQRDALDFTRAFRAKFPAWARAYEQQAQADTNKPPFTAEDQAKVSDLSTRLEKIQLECCERPDPTLQEEAIEIIREILELLPKDGGGGGQQQQQPQQNPQNQDKQQNQDQKNDQDQQQQQQDQGDDPQQDPGDKKDEEKEQQGSEEKEDPGDKEIEAVLKRAQERSDEHEAEKKARMKKIPLPPNERDW